MELLKFISNLFRRDILKTDLLYHGEEVKRKNLETRYNDLGIFNYDDLGFDIKLDNESYSIKWIDIERIQTYKVDLTTTDEICMDITFNNQSLMITEETCGWYQFIDKLQSALSEIKNDWEAAVLKSPFEYDLLTIYERIDRKMPARSNFFSTIKGESAEDICNVFRNQGWAIQNSSSKHFKIENSWTDLILESDDESLLLHGLVAMHPDNLKVIKLIFDRLQCCYQFEFYENNSIVVKAKNECGKSDATSIGDIAQHQ